MAGNDTLTALGLKPGQQQAPTPAVTPTPQPATPSLKPPENTAPTSPAPSQPSTPSDAAPVTTAMYREGDNSDGVRKLQEALNKNGATLEIDGKFGPGTKAAVESYQRSHSLDVDGIAGPKTLAALGITQVQNAPAATATQPAPPANAQPAQPAAPNASTPPAANDHGHSHAPTQPTPPANAPAVQSDKSLMSSPDFSDKGLNKLYNQAVSNLEQLGPSGGFKSREELEKAAAAVAGDAKKTGLTDIDHISKTTTPNGQTLLVAVQGDPTKDGSNRSYIDFGQATSQTVAQSTSMADKSPATPVAAQPALQTEQPQLEPIKIATSR